MNDEEGLDLPTGDFRIRRRYLAPWLFAEGEEGQTYPPPDDLISEEAWDSVVTLPTDVLLKSTSYEGSVIERLHNLVSDWIFSWPEIGQAPFMSEVALLAGEELDALVFNAAHGYYRQAIACLRNALEGLAIAAGLAVSGNSEMFRRWREEGEEIRVRQAWRWLRDSGAGRQVDHDATPASVFGDEDTSWMRARYKRLCAYAHSQSGYNNADFWESNGPVFRPRALEVVEAESRETLALAYLVLRIGCPDYSAGQGQQKLLAGPKADWEQYETMLRSWLL